MHLHTKNKDYTVEFTFEAAESETVQTAFDYFSGTYLYKGIRTNKTEEEMTDEEKTQAKISQVDAMMSGVSIMPKLAIDFLYMGLIEYHGKHSDGDGTVTCRDDAKRIYKEFCKENPEDELAMHSGLFNALKGQMETDGFFKRIGLEQMIEKMNQPNPNAPQDHKKKITKPLKTV